MTLLVGHVTRKIVSEMTYNVSCRMLNSAIPYCVDNTSVISGPHPVDIIAFSAKKLSFEIESFLKKP